MAKKKTTKNAGTKKSIDKLRKAAIKEIDASLNADTEKNAKGGAAKRKSSSKKASTKMTTKASKPPQKKKPSGLDLAAQVLVESKEPLNSKTIAERAIAAGWKTKGKTPHATIYAAMIREIKDKGKDARFHKADRGLFTSSGKLPS